MGVDKIGRPIYIEDSGKINPYEIWKVVEEDELWRSFYASYETLNELHYYALSHRYQKKIEHSVTILDFTGFSIGMMNKRMYALIGHASKITQDNYPESLGQMFIVNAPWAFTAVWSIIKAFLDEVTRNKI